jgi:hypothetical protein
LRRDVLAARSFEQFLLAIRDVEMAALVFETHVAGLEPTIFSEDGRRFVGLVVVAAHDVRPAHEQFALRVEAQLDAGEWQPD